MVVSAQELVSLLLNVGREVRGQAVSDLALFPLSVHTLIGNGSLHLSGEQCWSKRGWSWSLVLAGGPTGVVLASWPEPQAVFSLLPPCCDWE